MTNKTYDILNIPYTAEITATLAAVDALLGSLVTVLKSQYDKASTDGIEG